MIGKRNFLSAKLLLLFLGFFIFLAPLTQADYCGDINKDGDINILDIVELINYKYKGGPEPTPLVIADADHSGEINILDIVCIINFKYKNGPKPDCFLYDYTAIRGECQSGLRAKGEPTTTYRLTPDDCLDEPDGDNYMYVEMIGGDLHVFHINAYYNCCLEYRVEFVIDGNNIFAYEYDDGEWCHCDCYFNLESVLYGLPLLEYAPYTVTLFGIDGEPVGTDTVEPGDFDFMSLFKDEHDIIVRHYNAWYNCCLDYQIDYSISENEIIIYEYDVGEPCDCICFFDLETIIHNLPNGEYLVTLIDIYGDTVGSKSIEIYAGFELAEYNQSGCYDEASGSISYTYLFGNLTMQHRDAYFNCGAEDQIVIEFEQIGNILRFYEINTSDTPAFCMCYFELSATVYDIPPGEYVAEIYAVDYPGEPPRLVDRREIILE